MAEQSGFFPDVSGDRTYTTDFLALWIASIIGNGVYNGDLAVAAGSNMQIKIPSGRAWINGYHYRNDSDLLLSIANADGVLNRKDTVVLRWDVNARSITAQVLQGTPASSPTAPAITRGVEQYDLKLAEISIPAGTTAITQALITDTRPDETVCGLVTGVVQQLNTAALYTQFTAAFNIWFAGIKGKFGTDPAGNLQNEIDAHISRTDNPHGTTAAQVGAIPSARTVVSQFTGALGEGRYQIAGSSTSNTPRADDVWCIDICNTGWFETAVAKGSWSKTIYVAFRYTNDNGATFVWTPWVGMVAVLPNNTLTNDQLNSTTYPDNYETTITPEAATALGLPLSCMYHLKYRAFNKGGGGGYAVQEATELNSGRNLSYSRNSNGTTWNPWQRPDAIHDAINVSSDTTLTAGQSGILIGVQSACNITLPSPSSKARFDFHTNAAFTLITPSGWIYDSIRLISGASISFPVNMHFHIMSDGANWLIDSSNNSLDALEALYAFNVTPLSTPALRNNVISSAAPSGGSDGDTWDVVGS